MMDVEKFDIWTKPATDQKGADGLYCAYSVPNVWLSADFLRGGGFVNRFINLGGTIGQFVGSDLVTQRKKVVKAKNKNELLGHIDSDLWGLVIYGHGADGEDDIFFPDGTSVIGQTELRAAIAKLGYKLSIAYLMQCFSMSGNNRDEWEKVSNRVNGYDQRNVLLMDI